MSKFQFVMRSGPTPGKVFALDGTDLIIGRESSCNVSINDAEISRKHAKMELRGTAYVIQDLGSTNGTFVNGNRITGSQVLNPNDVVSFGENIVLMYESMADPNATVLSTKAPKTAAAAPKPTPVQAPAYSGQVPAGPPASAPVAAKKSNTKIIVIVLIVVAVCLIIGCVVALLWIDADPTGARWCQYLPFVARWLGAVCP